MDSKEGPMSAVNIRDKAGKPRTTDLVEKSRASQYPIHLPKDKPAIPLKSLCDAEPLKAIDSQMAKIENEMGKIPKEARPKDEVEPEIAADERIKGLTTEGKMTLYARYFTVVEEKKKKKKEEIDHSRH